MGYSGIRIYSGIYSRIYSGYSAPGSRKAGMEIQVFRNENSSQTNAYSHYSNYSYSGLIPNERALSFPAPIYTSGWRALGSGGVACLTQNKTLSPARAQTRATRSVVKCTNHEVTACESISFISPYESENTSKKILVSM